MFRKSLSNNNGHRTKCTPSRFHVIVIAFIYLEYKQISSTKSNQSRRQYPVDRLTRNYIPCLGQRGQNPYPVQRHNVPCIDHIWEFTPGGLSACFSFYCDFVVQTSRRVDTFRGVLPYISHICMCRPIG